MHALEAEDVQKSFGSFSALRGMTLQVPRGEFLAIFGANGAGKTTFLKVCSTLLRPTKGRLRIEGLDIREQPEAVRRNLGFLSHNTYLYRDLSPIENLRLFAALYGIDKPGERIESMIARVGLKSRANDPVRSFSRGLQQRLGVARAVLHSPSLVLLDEPYTGLDANAADTLNALLDELHLQGKTVILTSHDLDQGLRSASRAVIIDRGKAVFDGTASDPAVRDAYQKYVRRGAER